MANYIFALIDARFDFIVELPDRAFNNLSESKSTIQCFLTTWELSIDGLYCETIGQVTEPEWDLADTRINAYIQPKDLAKDIESINYALVN